MLSSIEPVLSIATSHVINRSSVRYLCEVTGGTTDRVGRMIQAFWRCVCYISYIPSPNDPYSDLLTLSAGLNRAKTVEDAVAHTIDLSEVAFEQPFVSVCEYDSRSGTVTAIRSSPADPDPSDRVHGQLATSADGFSRPGGRRLDGGDSAGNGRHKPPKPLQADVLVPVSPTHVLSTGTTDRDGFDDTDVAIIEGLSFTVKSSGLGTRTRTAYQ